MTKGQDDPKHKWLVTKLVTGVEEEGGGNMNTKLRGWFLVSDRGYRRSVGREEGEPDVTDVKANVLSQ